MNLKFIYYRLIYYLGIPDTGFHHSYERVSPAQIQFFLMNLL